jgi:hypothetical protein
MKQALGEGVRVKASTGINDGGSATKCLRPGRCGWERARESASLREKLIPPDPLLFNSPCFILYW